MSRFCDPWVLGLYCVMEVRPVLDIGTKVFSLEKSLIIFVEAPKFHFPIKMVCKMIKFVLEKALSIRQIDLKL